MRTHRTNRRVLKQELIRLSAENSALKELVNAMADKVGGNAVGVNADTANCADGGSAEQSPHIIGKGFPTRCKPLRAKDLHEAKAILLAMSGEW